ncbi:hypothetical protein [Flavobacterium sp. HTF]|uniref:DUF6438 domain-containing protein n=1 Tax=Flavobacterium sp. HTF TaxID=2170732 RepID=UPI000D5D867A|nr:hypothetical protein [Flavobacterium sp. HTF]PWB24925.1 hypothetical protein DCO46_10380 [Flavobacterium sp. HTF]
MKNSLIIIFLSLLLLSCTEKRKVFDSFDYSYESTFSEVYSIKFTQSDTVYLRYHWIGRNIDDTTSTTKENTNYYGILNSEERLRLFDYIEKVNLFKYKSEYFQNYSDGSSYGINIQKNSKNKTVFVHSHKAPKEIDSISNWIGSIKHKLKLKEIKKNIIFESTKGVLPPPPPPPVIKN